MVRPSWLDHVSTLDILGYPWMVKHGKTLIRLISMLIGQDPSGKSWLRHENALLKSVCSSAFFR